ncbi:MAG: hypothetical protein Sylvanvirus1_74 [Sylvanvirus sp.]|uniref:Uncharacterized protein n=1 Tax=Sylvanvirus sp. TaxID=2487774 RepID=A0A3G5AH69_9VIRU|nr:MAG: hypothetical protein Sylvanvirus1_74 [Sylvanvirus sp.]
MTTVVVDLASWNLCGEVHPDPCQLSHEIQVPPGTQKILLKLMDPGDGGYSWQSLERPSQSAVRDPTILRLQNDTSMCGQGMVGCFGINQFLIVYNKPLEHGQSYVPSPVFLEIPPGHDDIFKSVHDATVLQLDISVT